MEQPAPLPADRLHAALPQGHEGHAAIDGLNAELSRPSPDRDSIESHVERLRTIPELTARVENWFDDPATQRFIAILDSIGL